MGRIGKNLLAREAAVIAQSQGNNRLTILVGDSLSLWLPTEQLPQNRFWLNQSISGETMGQILTRLHYFQGTRPGEVHIMAGINDLKNGASDGEVIRNIQQMLVQLRQQHPQARLVIYSILPTRLGNLPSDRIRQYQPLHRLRGGSAGGRLCRFAIYFLATTKACCGVNSLLMGCT